MEVSVRLCTEAEALEILRDRSVQRFLSIVPERIHEGWIRLMMDDIMLVLAKPESGELEVHIACRYRDRVKAKQTIPAGLEWLVNQGYEKIWTTAPDDRKGLTNMLESFQFRRAGERWVYGY